MKRILFLALLAPALLCAADSKKLFNGKDMTGWRFVGPGSFTVENGLLTTHGGMGLLVYDKEPFGNAVLKVVYKVTGEHDNSGVYIRMPESAPDPLYGVHNGYEVQIDAAGDDWHCTGAIYSLSKAVKRTQILWTRRPRNPCRSWSRTTPRRSTNPNQSWMTTRWSPPRTTSRSPCTCASRDPAR